MKLLGRLIVVLAFFCHGPARAELMPAVLVDGQEWLQPLDFVTQSWSDIAAVCDTGTGVCNGSLGRNDLTSWLWAGVPDINALFTAFGIPGFTGMSEATGFSRSGSTWASDFLAAFLPTGEGPTGEGSIGGHMRSSGLVEQAAIGVVIRDVNLPRIGPADFADTGVILTGPAIDDPSPGIGGWFYKTQVPSPATLPLLVIGFAALGFSDRKRVRHS